MTTLFISDLHLHESRPEVTQTFLQFLEAAAGQTDALYILGDLFEVWIGDDDPDPHHRQVVTALQRFSAAGADLFVARGNRDVILGRRFCREAGAQLLEETTVIDVYGTQVLVSHGDELCTDDVAYQRFAAGPAVRPGAVCFLRYRWRCAVTLPITCAGAVEPIRH